MYIRIKIIFYFAVLAANALSIRERVLDDDEVEEIRHHASLLINGRYACAAALITKLHLLTAAHCVSTVIQVGPTEAYPMIAFGTGLPKHAILYTIKRISHHKNFVSLRPYFYENDIAVIRLVHSVQFSQIIFPIGLPSMRLLIPDHSVVMVTGYHLITANISEPMKVSKLYVQTISAVACQLALPYFSISESQMCTLVEDSLGCSPGDEGAPMVDINGKFIIGILSVPANGITNRTVDVYSKVGSFRDYINQEIHYIIGTELIQHNDGNQHPSYNY